MLVPLINLICFLLEASFLCEKAIQDLVSFGERFSLCGPAFYSYSLLPAVTAAAEQTLVDCFVATVFFPDKHYIIPAYGWKRKSGQAQDKGGTRPPTIPARTGNFRGPRMVCLEYVTLSSDSLGVAIHCLPHLPPKASPNHFTVIQGIKIKMAAVTGNCILPISFPPLEHLQTMQWLG